MTISVVIAAHDAATVIEPCLRALEPQRAKLLEVIVADSSTDATAPIVSQSFPWVRLIHFDEPLTVPELRGRGIADASGDVIAILDPFSVAAPDWADCVRDAHLKQPHLAIGGVVGMHAPEKRGLAAWTLYFNEYGLFMPPALHGETWIVPGSNVTYKRSALYTGSSPRYPVFWKTFVNADIERAGSPLFLADTIRVDLNKPIPFGDFLLTRFAHGRCFAGMRVRHASLPTRIVRALSTTVLPAVLMWRWSRGFWPKRRHRLRFAATLPAQLALFGMWSLGEACGYLRGSGRACERLYY